MKKIINFIKLNWPLIIAAIIILYILSLMAK